MISEVNTTTENLNRMFARAEFMNTDNQSKQSILVIDDERPILRMLTQALSRHGYHVDAVDDGEKGLEKIAANRYSVILTDIVMPGISGKQISHHLKQVMKDSTPIIGMSGTPWLLEDGSFDSVLSKPYSIKEMLDVIRTLT